MNRLEGRQQSVTVGAVRSLWPPRSVGSAQAGQPIGEYGVMPVGPIALRRGTTDDMEVVIQLIEEVAEWLRQDKGTDQWARPWPNRTARDSRILASLSQGKTWIGWDDGIPAVTITADPDEDPTGPTTSDTSQPSTFAAKSSGAPTPGSGSALRSSSGSDGPPGGTAVRSGSGPAPGPRTPTCTPTTSARALSRAGSHADDGYPSAARFQKPAAPRPPSGPGLFRVSWTPGPRG
jgi:hypothetical protein